MELKFGTIVRVKAGGRHDTSLLPLALLADEGVPVFGWGRHQGKKRFYGLFIDRFPHPTEIAWANVYTDEVEGVEVQLSDKGAIALLDEVRQQKPIY